MLVDFHPALSFLSVAVFFLELLLEWCFSLRAGGFVSVNRGVLIGGARAFSWGALEALFFLW